MNFTRLPIQFNTTFLPENMGLYRGTESLKKSCIRVVYYVGTKLLNKNDVYSIAEFSKNTRDIPGFIEVIIDAGENALYIVFLSSVLANRGLGTFLMCSAILTGFFRGINNIYLDDVTCRFREALNCSS